MTTSAALSIFLRPLITFVLMVAIVLPRALT